VQAAAEAACDLVARFVDALLVSADVSEDTLGEVAQALLQRYFQVGVFRFVPSSLMCVQLFLLPAFRRDMRRVLRAKISALLAACPHMVGRLRV
jgi:hypothetical protein